ncbi:hypothetical protein L3X38_019100 [Prunus dulcis]|uniref:Protein kinase domain-containing protein n=1 Tax=Prunus dulcis TaxID=3755 RepID=A0AAD4WAE6_PRUDU|nr:hypothetical protein L3X38_019100 [Prunus dulcis]
MQPLLHMIILLLWRISQAAASSSDQLAPIAKPNCETHCGDVSIPYPFGIGPSSNCYFPFVYSWRYNRLTAVSCGIFLAVMLDETVVGGCMSTCDTDHFRRKNYGCIGINCCQTTLPSDLSVITIELQPESEMGTRMQKRTGTRMDDYNYAFIVDQEWFENNLDVKDKGSVPVVLEWSLRLDNMNSSSAKLYEELIVSTPKNNLRNPLVSFGGWDPIPYCTKYDPKNFMQFFDNQSRLYCFCPPGFEGNPYLLQPCQDIDECKGPNTNRCKIDDPATNFSVTNRCKNYVGGHSCYSIETGITCQYYGTADALCFFHTRWGPLFFPIQIILPGLGLILGLLLLLIYVYKRIHKRKKIKRKKMFFKRNGGLLLEQQLSSNKGNVEKIKLFKSKELERSTHNFKINRILGHGGQGTVYKGMLADGRLVAVKKSKIVDEGKLSEFINEVVILSQINHMNVVKILGCWLETEVPILVYEFIPNGTLAEYIQGQVEEVPLTWEMRLRIATEIAGALSYLHGAASFPIFHRDIKSTNILLDEKYRAKVADFGTSRSVSIDQTHLTTLTNGTFGYLDPEYFHSNRFTDKSDVYSFGVVLVELLTGRKPVCAVTSSEENEYRSLATHFIISMQEDCLFDIVEARILKEGSKTGINEFANLAGRCLNVNGRNRPTMREVTTELEAIQKSETAYNGAQPNYEGV